MMDRKVIIHIGYFKTGTTWFQEVFFPKVNNIAFSNRANSSLDENLILIRPFDFSSEKVRGHIDDLLPVDDNKTLLLSRERLSGHPFTGGYDAKLIGDRLKATYSDATVVLFIREQKKAIVSTYKEYVKRGGIAPFEKWIYTHERTIPSFQLDYFNYHKHVSYYYELFGKSNVKVYAYEDFTDEPQKFLTAFSKELNLDIDLSQFDFNKKVNKGFSTKSLKLLRWANKFSKNKNLNPYPAIKIPFLRFIITKFCKFMDVMFYSWMNHGFLKPKILVDIDNRFKESNAELNQLLDMDIKSKGYICSDFNEN
ncbi:sulfotransferase domain-containing protein [Bizionia arctica]|uniref:Sulfotransferase domain-containing protein n=1 Tax=Bizionia arctica TaxID=1495645 RepID=A0A917LVR3_9FLAO|nr:sulfotransferase domain-containing protein [Bizionia arctica]GGG60102.1 hypothetical protein GCM10010976_33570 [Bizionia arctica]